MEDNIKNQSSDIPQILNWRSEDQTKIQIALNEDDFKILKDEYLSDHWLDLPHILNYVTYEFLGGY